MIRSINTSRLEQKLINPSIFVLKYFVIRIIKSYLITFTIFIEN